ncbi:MAG: hypothetical protein HQL21_08765 [Candidatus Omnitrophica bacterium]|nr:hypothetical protein [Candidatus Omnitrophota bacterium]
MACADQEAGDAQWIALPDKYEGIFDEKYAGELIVKRESIFSRRNVRLSYDQLSGKYRVTQGDVGQGLGMISVDPATWIISGEKGDRLGKITALNKFVQLNMPPGSSVLFTPSIDRQDFSENSGNSSIGIGGERAMSQERPFVVKDLWNDPVVLEARQDIEQNGALNIFDPGTIAHSRLLSIKSIRDNRASVLHPDNVYGIWEPSTQDPESVWIDTASRATAEKLLAETADAEVREILRQALSGKYMRLGILNDYRRIPVYRHANGSLWIPKRLQSVEHRNRMQMAVEFASPGVVPVAVPAQVADSGKDVFYELYLDGYEQLGRYGAEYPIIINHLPEFWAWMKSMPGWVNDWNFGNIMIRLENGRLKDIKGVDLEFLERDEAEPPAVERMFLKYFGAYLRPAGYELKGGNLLKVEPAMTQQDKQRELVLLGDFFEKAIPEDLKGKFKTFFAEDKVVHQGDAILKTITPSVSDLSEIFYDEFLERARGKTLVDYLGYLASDSGREEYLALQDKMRQLFTHKTDRRSNLEMTTFFRGQKTWEVDEFLKEGDYLYKKYKKGNLSITTRHVSASEGHEPYSVAILIYKNLGDLYHRLQAEGESLPSEEEWIKRWKVDIHAYDFLLFNLMLMRRGYFNKYRLEKSMPKQEDRIFFEKINWESEYYQPRGTMGNVLRSWIKPHYLDLNSNSVDMINKYDSDITFSRETLIYLEYPRVVSVLRRLLDPKGWNREGGHLFVLSNTSGALTVHFTEDGEYRISDNMKEYVRESIARASSVDSFGRFSFYGLLSCALIASDPRVGQLIKILEGAIKIKRKQADAGQGVSLTMLLLRI